MVYTTAMFRAIKEHNPQARVIVIGNTINKMLLADNTDVDEYIVFDGDVFSLARMLREKNIILHVPLTRIESLAAFFLAGVRSIAVPEVVRRF